METQAVSTAQLTRRQWYGIGIALAGYVLGVLGPMLLFMGMGDTSDMDAFVAQQERASTIATFVMGVALAMLLGGLYWWDRARRQAKALKDAGIPCTECHHPERQGARFCSACGHAIAI